MGNLIQKKKLSIKNQKKVLKMQGNSTSTIGCKQKLVDYECAVTFKDDSPSTGIYHSYEEDRPYSYACETYHRHEFCGCSFRCDETSYTLEIGQYTPLFFHFCQLCAEKIMRYCKHSGEGTVYTKGMQAERNFDFEQEMKKKR